MKTIGILLLIAAAIFTILALAVTQNQGPSLNNEILNLDCSGDAICTVETVRSIIDGDTIYTDKYKIRLSLTNTPERNETGYIEATTFTSNLCPVGSQIIIDQDDLQLYDVYDRLLGKVTCANKILNAELLHNGHANILTQYCNTSEFSTEEWAIKYGC